MCQEGEPTSNNHPYPCRAEPGGSPPAQAIDKNLLLQQRVKAILQISLQPISFDEQMHRILELILQLPWLAGQRNGWIYLADEDAKVLILKSQVGMAVEAMPTCSRVPFGTCLCGRAIADNEIVFAGCRDARHTIQYPGIQPHGHYCIPLSSGGRRVGLLNLYVQADHPPDRFLRLLKACLPAGLLPGPRLRRPCRCLARRRAAPGVSERGVLILPADFDVAMLREQLEGLRPEGPKVRVEPWMVQGYAATEILRIAAETKCDLILMGTHGRSGLGRLFVGSVAEQILRRASCPVVTVKAPQAQASVAEAPARVAAGMEAKAIP